MSIEENKNEDLAFLALKKEYQKTISAKLETLEKLIKILEKTGDLATLVELHRLVHKIVGSAGTYGYGRTSKIGKKFTETLSRMIEEFPASLEGDLWVQKIKKHMQHITESFYGT